MKQKGNLYSLVGCGVMLVAALLFDWMEAFGQSIGLMKMGGMSVLMRICSILLLVAPVCVALYDVKEEPQLASLKKYLSFDKRIAHALPLALLLIFYLFFSTDKDVRTYHAGLTTGFTLYLIAAVIVVALPFVNLKGADSEGTKGVNP